MIINRFLLLCCFVSSCSTINEDINTPVVEQNIDCQYLLKDFTVLASDELQGRKTQTEGSILAQNFLITQLQQHKILPFQGIYRHPFTIPHKELIGSNVVAYVKGHQKLNKIIVISAHYDHLGTTSMQQVFNGADDNASGTAAVLTLAKQIIREPLKHDVIFLFTDAEELGLQGSKAFLREIGSFRENIILNVNLDMLAGSNEQNTLYTINQNLSKILSLEHLERLKLLQRSFKPKVLANFKRARGSLLNDRINFRKASDHSAFNHYKIPYIYFGVGTHKNYHTINDTFENANTNLYVKNVQNIFKQLIYLDNSVD